MAEKPRRDDEENVPRRPQRKHKVNMEKLSQWALDHGAERKPTREQVQEAFDAGVFPRAILRRHDVQGDDDRLPQPHAESGVAGSGGAPDQDAQRDAPGSRGERSHSGPMCAKTSCISMSSISS